MMAGYRRALWRICGPVGFLALWYGYVVYPLFTSLVGLAAIGVCSYRAGLWGRRTWREWRYNRTVRRPLVDTLAFYVQLLPAAVDAGLVISKDLVQVPLGPTFKGTVEQVKDITRVVSQRIGGEWDVDRNTTAYPFYLRFTPKPAPPEVVFFEQVREAVYATSQDKPVLGLGSRHEVLHLDFTGEIAHLAASIGTGGGKSSFLRFLIAQFAHHGVGSFDVCDVKWVSLQGMEAVPGLRIHRPVEEIAEAIGNVKAEMQRRYDILLKNPSKVFDRRILVLEEQNAFATLARLAWRATGKKGNHPVWDDIALILTMARQVNIIVIGAYQRMTAAASGGGELRDQYGLKLLSRFSHQAWDVLVGTRPRGVSSPIPGRAIAVMGESQRTVQLPFVTVKEALELALSGVPVTVTAPEYHEVSAPSPVTVTTPQYTLAEAAREPWCPVSYDTLKQRAHRARKAGKLPVAKAYTREELEPVLGGDSA